MMILLQLNKTNDITKSLSLMMLICCVLFSTASFANIGKVIYNYGENYALDLDGNRRDLSKGEKINEGDTLVTGIGRMQVRLIDGGLISVYPNSEYKIEQFKFASAKRDPKGVLLEMKESKSDRGFFNLLKGAARQVTGVLGRKYKENFKFKTTIATVGIRGTGFFTRLCQANCFDTDGNPLQDGMYVKNNIGVITMENNAGDIALAQGQAAFAASSEDAPVQTDKSPAGSDEGSEEIETFDFEASVVGENIQINSNTPPEPEVVPPVVNVKNLDFSFIGNSGTNIEIGVFDLDNTGSSIVQSGNEITRFESINVTPVIVFDKADGILEESGINTALGVMWNRWSGGYSLTKNGVDVAPVDPNIHLIGSDQLTQNILNLAPKGDVEYVGTSATSPTLSIAGSTMIGTQTFHAGLNFTGLNGGRGIEMNHLTISTDFGDMQAELHLDNTLDLTSAKGIALMHGHCRDCNGVNTPEIRMNGFSTVNVVGDNAEGIFGSYNLTGGGAVISGSYVGAEE